MNALALDQEPERQPLLRFRSTVNDIRRQNTVTKRWQVAAGLLLRLHRVI